MSSHTNWSGQFDADSPWPFALQFPDSQFATEGATDVGLCAVAGTAVYPAPRTKDALWLLELSDC